MAIGKKKENRMRIGIDARLWDQSGVGRYIRNLVLNLLLIDQNNEYVLFVRSDDEKKIKEQINEYKIKDLKLEIVKVDLKWHSIREQVLFPRILNDKKLDLVHFPYFSMPIFYKKNYIVTIHDLILHHYISGKSSTLPIWLYGFKMLAYKTIMNLSAKNAKKIIAVSKSTKDEIIDHLITDKNKINVIYEAADDLNHHKSIENEYGKFFLFVGNVYTHKNAYLLLDAFEKVYKNLDVKLIFAGKNDYFYKRLISYSKRFNDKIIFIENPSDDELVSLYRNSVCLIRPSFMEGFSLPPLEAISNNCLALVSDIPVHREILKDGAIYFNPNDKMDLVDKMKFILQMSNKDKEEMMKKGNLISQEYSWEKTARQTLYLYENISS